MDDIENIIQNKNLLKFGKELFVKNFTSNIDYVKHYDVLKKTYKICPNKPTLNKLYHKLLKDGEIDENTSFLQFSIKKSEFGSRRRYQGRPARVLYKLA